MAEENGIVPVRRMAVPDVEGYYGSLRHIDSTMPRFTRTQPNTAFGISQWAANDQEAQRAALQMAIVNDFDRDMRWLEGQPLEVQKSWWHDQLPIKQEYYEMMGFSAPRDPTWKDRITGAASWLVTNPMTAVGTVYQGFKGAFEVFDAIENNWERLERANLIRMQEQGHLGFVQVGDQEVFGMSGGGMFESMTSPAMYDAIKEEEDGSAPWRIGGDDFFGLGATPFGGLFQRFATLIPGEMIFGDSDQREQWMRAWNEAEHFDELVLQDFKVKAAEVTGASGMQLEFLQGVSSMIDGQLADNLDEETVSNAAVQYLLESVREGRLDQETSSQVYGDFVAGLQTRPELMKGIELMVGAKLSAGRVAMHLTGLEPGTAAFDRGSGYIDAIDAFLDPTLVAGPVIKTARSARSGVKTLDDFIEKGLTSVGRRALRDTMPDLLEGTVRGVDDPDLWMSNVGKWVSENPQFLRPGLRTTLDDMTRLGNETVKAEIMARNMAAGGNVTDEIADIGRGYFGDNWQQLVDSGQVDMARAIRIRAFHASQNVEGFFGRVGNALRGRTEEGVGQVRQILKQQPKLTKIASLMVDDVARVEKLREAGRVTVDELGQLALREELGLEDSIRWFYDKKTFESVLRGDVAGHLRNVKMLPISSVTARAGKTVISEVAGLALPKVNFSRAKNAAAEVIDWARESPVRIIGRHFDEFELEDQLKLIDHFGPWSTARVRERRAMLGLVGQKTDRASGVGQRLADLAPIGRGRFGRAQLRFNDLTVQDNFLRVWAAGAARAFGETAKMATTTAPAGVLHLDDLADVGKVAAIAEANLPTKLADEFVSMWMASDSVGVRTEMVRGLYEDMFWRSGILDLPNGNEWATRFLSDLTDLGTAGQRYSVLDHDIIRGSLGNKVRSSIYDAQNAHFLAIPDWGKLMAYTKKGAVGNLLGGTRALNNSYMDFVVGKIWAPSVLLRLGFPIRAVGDEVFAEIMREGFASWVKGRAAVSGYKSQNDRVFEPVARTIERTINSVGRRIGGDEPGRLTAAMTRFGRHKEAVRSVFAVRRDVALKQMVGPEGVARLEKTPVGRKVLNEINDFLAGDDAFREAMDTVTAYTNLDMQLLINDFSAGMRGSRVHMIQGQAEGAIKEANETVLANVVEELLQPGIRTSSEWLPYLPGSQRHSATFTERLAQFGDSFDRRVAIDNLQVAIRETPYTGGPYDEWIDEIVEAALEPTKRTLMETGYVHSEKWNMAQMSRQTPDGRRLAGNIPKLTWGRQGDELHAVAPASSASTNPLFEPPNWGLGGADGRYGNGMDLVIPPKDVDPVRWFNEFDHQSLLGFRTDDAVTPLENLSTWKLPTENWVHLDDTWDSRFLDTVDDHFAREFTPDNLAESIGDEISELARELETGHETFIQLGRSPDLVEDVLSDLLDELKQMDELLGLVNAGEQIPKHLEEKFLQGFSTLVFYGSRGPSWSAVERQLTRLFDDVTSQIPDRAESLVDELTQSIRSVLHKSDLSAFNAHPALPIAMRRELADTIFAQAGQPYGTGPMDAFTAQLSSRGLVGARWKPVQHDVERMTLWLPSDAEQGLSRSRLKTEIGRGEATLDEVVRARTESNIRDLMDSTGLWVLDEGGRITQTIPTTSWLDTIKETNYGRHLDQFDVEERIAAQMNSKLAMADEAVRTGQFEHWTAERTPAGDFNLSPGRADDPAKALLVPKGLLDEPQLVGSDLRAWMDANGSVHANQLAFPQVLGARYMENAEAMARAAGPEAEGKTTLDLIRDNPELYKEKLRRVFSALVEKPFELAGYVMDWIGRDPMLAVRMGRAQREMAPVWRELYPQAFKTIDGLPQINDRLIGLIDEAIMFPSKTTTTYHAVEETSRGHDLMKVWTRNDGSQVLQVNDAAIAADFENGFEWLHAGVHVGTGTVEGARMTPFRLLGIEPGELAEALGTPERYREFLEKVAGRTQPDDRGRILMSVDPLDDVHAIVGALEDMSRIGPGGLVEGGLKDLIADGSLRPRMLRHMNDLEPLARGRMDDLLSSETSKLGAAVRDVIGEGVSVPDALRFAREVEENYAVNLLKRAHNDMIPWIDSQATGSYLTRLGKNIVPFWWAEERFLKRMAGTLFHSPEAMKKMHLAYSGLHNTGMIHIDDRGDSYFIQPGSQMGLDALVFFQNLLGVGPDVVLPSELRDQFRLTGSPFQILPGLDEPGRPNPIWTMSIPLKTLMDHFPSTRLFVERIIGEHAASPSTETLDLILPSTIRRVWGGVDEEELITAHGDAVATAAQILAASNDYDLDPEAGPLNAEGQEIPQDEFLEDVLRIAQNVVWLKAIYGFLGSAPPRDEYIAKNEVLQDFEKKVGAFGFQRGLELWVAENPNANLFLVSATPTLGGGRIDSTQRTFEFMQENGELLSEFPFAAPYLIPTDLAEKEGDSYYHQAWVEQQILGLRERFEDREDVAEYITALRIARDAPAYYREQDAYLTAREEFKGTPGAIAIDEAWRAWADQYRRQHPTFASELGADGQNRRRIVMSQLTEIMASNRVPDNPQTQDLVGLHNEFLRYQQFVGSLGLSQKTVIVQQRAAAKQMLIANVHNNWLPGRPWLESYYYRIMLPELSIDSDEAVELAFATEEAS